MDVTGYTVEEIETIEMSSFDDDDAYARDCGYADYAEMLAVAHDQREHIDSIIEAQIAADMARFGDDIPA